jgi:hypothetical protein
MGEVFSAGGKAMDGNIPIKLVDILYIALAMAGVGILISLALLGWIIWRVKRIQLPPDADFLTALRATPLAVVVLLDLLDFSLDIFSAPLAWTLLGYLGLKPLRGVSVVESLIPGTQFLPTMTGVWIIARLIGPGYRL